MSMMKLLKRLLAKLKRQPQTVPLLSPEEEAQLDKDVEAVLAPIPRPQGQVIKSTRPAEYSATTMRHGGRVVRAMPRQLQKIKAAQEKVEDEAVRKL
jgi:hypothetical protein